MTEHHENLPSIDTDHRNVGELSEPQSSPSDPDLMPRPQRRRRRDASEVGLGTDQNLRELSAAFHNQRREYFPELAAKGAFPAVTDTLIDQMVADLKARHGTGVVTDVDVAELLSAKARLGACYLRYSDENSQSRSIIDQLREVMKRAAKDGIVLTWSCLFVDYARSAVYDTRLGFEAMLKRLGAEKPQNKVLEAVFIDEFARGSRDDDDSWRLAGMCNRQGINLAAADGFDLQNDSDWDLKIRIFNIVNAMEKKNKSHRVKRGMRGVAEDGRVLGRIPDGYTGRIRRDANGNVVTGNKDKPVHDIAIDPEARVWVREMFELAMIKKWSLYKIVKHFNDNKIDGWDGCTEASLKIKLINPAYIGLFTWGKTTQIFNHETREYETKHLPWTEWSVFYDKNLALVPKAWHVAMRKKYAKGTKRKAAKRLPDRVAVTLFSKALKCGYCGGDIKMFRSAKKYKNMYCPNGPKGVHGCKLSASKSVRVIEQCLLDHLDKHLLTEDAVQSLVEKANIYLAEEAAKPLADARPEKAQLRKLEKQCEKLIDRVLNEGDEKLCKAYDGKIAKLQGQIDSLRDVIREKEVKNAPAPPPLDIGRVKLYLSDLQSMLAQEVPASAEAIADLTGPIHITQEPVPGMRRGAKWVARFSPDLMRLLAKVASEIDYPDCATVEFLCRATRADGPRAGEPHAPAPPHPDFGWPSPAVSSRVLRGAILGAYRDPGGATAERRGASHPTKHRRLSAVGADPHICFASSDRF